MPTQAWDMAPDPYRNISWNHESLFTFRITNTPRYPGPCRSDATIADATGYGRVLRDPNGIVRGIHLGVVGKEGFDHPFETGSRGDMQRRPAASVDALRSGAMGQEQKVFDDLAAARANYSGAQTVNDQVAAATQVDGALGRLLAIVENYPQLKSIDAVQTFMAQDEGTENRISVERGRFNEAVQSYNTAIKSFPSLFYAGFFGFKERPYFAATPGSEKPPQVKFDFNKTAAPPAVEKP